MQCGRFEQVIWFRICCSLASCNFNSDLGWNFNRDLSETPLVSQAHKSTVYTRYSIH